MLGDGECTQVLQGHSDRVRAVALCSSGKTLYSGGEDSVIVQWCTATGMPLHRFTGHTDVVWALVLAPADDVLYSGSADCTVRAWNTQNGDTLHVINPQRGWVRALAVSPPSIACYLQESANVTQKLFTGSMDWFIEARSMASNQLVHRIPSGIGRLDLIHALAVSDDGGTLYSGGTGCVIRAWDTDIGECRHKFEGHTDTIFSLHLSHKSTRLWSAAGDRAIRCWRVSDQQCLQVIRTRHTTTTICVSRDSRTLFSSPYGQDGIGVWNIDARVGMVASPRKQRAYSDVNDGLGKERQCDRVLKGHTAGESIYGLAFSADTGRLYSASGDCSIRGWQVAIPTKWTRAVHSCFPPFFRAMIREILRVASHGNGACVSQISCAPSEDADPDFNLLASMRNLEPQLIEQLVEVLAEQFISDATAAH